ncbi:hypothetical protein DCC39_03965 [Pueribacillus theae]|uniref:Metallo-beta-lactamase domain-containing protein n=1 Tax=Pueribacillus theae TaxID=2171751 RepID=A0A2U1K5L8_9BACI|nr:MBL fold metallo-hydrolase [Pueribacillus theae]PWA12810.1 hypothetical protein DCC39_03965 [Pueribacillus theae]
MKEDFAQQVEVIKLPIHCFLPSMSIFIYFVDGLLIDTGPRFKRKRLSRLFQRLNIEKVAITHLHKDHSGMASWISKNLDVPIYINKTPARRFHVSDRLFSDRFSREAEQYPDKIELEHHTFIPIETPGHTRDHICLYEPNKGWLFTGDLYITPHPKVSLRTESIAHYISSLNRVIQLDFDTVFCAHQGIIRNGRNSLIEKLEYLQEMQFQAVQLYKQGYSERMIAKQLFPKKARLERLSFGTFSSLHFVRSCLRAHTRT